MTPLNITHIFAPSRAGGLERVVEMLALGHAARGHHVSAVAIIPAAWDEPPILGQLRAGGVRVDLLRIAGRDYAKERRAFREVAGRYSRDTVFHSHGYRADVLYGRAAADLGLPTITTLHGFTGGDFKNRVYEYIQRRTARRFQRVVAVSRPIERRMLASGIRPERLRLIPNAYQIAGATLPRDAARAKLGIQGDGFVVGWVGRVSHEKGADVFVRALAELDGDDIRAVVVGEGNELARVKTLASSLDVDSRIAWAGTVDGVSALLPAFDALALSSRTEGTPIILFEAMAARVPIVATRVGGVPDVLTPAEAVLVPSEAPAALAAGIRSVQANPDAAAQRAASAYQVLVTRYEPTQWLNAYERVYREALAAASSR